MASYNEARQLWNTLIGQADEVVQTLGGSCQHSLTAEVDWTRGVRAKIVDYKLRRVVTDDADPDAIRDLSLFVIPRDELSAMRVMTFDSQSPESLKVMNSPLERLHPVTDTQDRDLAIEDIKRTLLTALLPPKPIWL
jgi:hypothetical protein